MMDAVSRYFRNSPTTVDSRKTCSIRRYFYLWVPLHKIYECWNMRSVLLRNLREAHEKFGDKGQIRVVDWNSNLYSPNCVPSPEHDYTASVSSSELFTGFRKTLVDKSTVRLALEGRSTQNMSPVDPTKVTVGVFRELSKKLYCRYVLTSMYIFRQGTAGRLRLSQHTWVFRALNMVKLLWRHC